MTSICRACCSLRYLPLTSVRTVFSASPKASSACSIERSFSDTSRFLRPQSNGSQLKVKPTLATFFGRKLVLNGET